jgi:2-haloacid dehalogenase
MIVEGIAACVFDAYGTLFDVHSPVAQLTGRLGPSAFEFSKLWRQKQLEYTWLRSLMREHVDFWHVTGDALDYSMAFHGITDLSLREELMALYLQLRAYPDAVSCIETLAKTPFKMAILSNGTPAMLTEAATFAGIADYFHEIISVEEVGIFKPDPRVYGQALVRLHIDQPSAILFVSANPWDAQAAARFGFQTVRVDRFSVPHENLPGRPAAVISGLADFPQIIRRPGR